ncbi:scaffolding protein [Pseudomonas phage AH02]|nr:scaffolding protein [Pseudomonas phage AH02]
MAMTLEELRAENAAEEAKAAAVPQTDAEEVEDDAGDEEFDDTDQADDQDEEQEQTPEPEGWMKGDTQESRGAEKKFTDSDVGAAKAKMRAKLEKQHQSELDQLRAQLEEARSRQVEPKPSARPRRDDFFDHDDPDDAYTEALADWKVQEALAKQNAGTQQYEQQRKQLEAHAQMSSKVDQHYERAAKLAQQSGITPENYQSADYRVRNAIEGLYPGKGEQITDELIASVGEGSEKVMYALGVNQKRLGEFLETMRNDPRGIATAIHLGKLATELTTPARKKSKAPAPATDVQGDMQTSDKGKGLHRKYLEARKSGDAQKAFDIRREARTAKINVDSW